MADETVQTEKVHPFKAEVETENAKRTGKGLRVAFGNTRGKGSIPIKWEEFDLAQVDTLPSTVAEFMELTGVKDQNEILAMLITGYNESNYKDASDPLAEHVNPAWDKDIQTLFRNTVRAYVKATAALGTTIEKAVEMIKPGVEAAHNAKVAK